MNGSRRVHFRKRLTEMQSDLALQDDLGRTGQETVTLDQQSVGRLSRMDALQQQAMAQATQARRARMKIRIRAALERITDDEFGYCAECGELIAEKRLDLDPTVATCISCASG